MASSSPRQARGEPGGAREGALSVTELNRAAREVLETRLGDVWVQGEISRFSAYASGHWYFTLKDAGAAVSAVMFRGANRLCRVQPAEGMQVLVRGRVSIYEQRGTYQVVCEHLEPAGEGALFAAFERLKKKLAEEGLFDPERKRRLPLLPRRIGVATSPSGAALRDILKVLETRGARLHVVIAPCRVQGEGSAEEIAHALRLLDARGDLDAVIVGRGGGSLEDLWAFNEEAVARAIHAMGVPVISAVGHEIDTTIADLVADVRAATPSQAAELVSASALEVEEHLRVTLSRLRQSARAACGEARARLARAEPRRLASRVAGRVERLSQHVDALTLRLGRAARQEVHGRRLVLAGLARRIAPEGLAALVRLRRERLAERMARLAVAARARVLAERERTKSAARALEALSPLAVLERGYAVLRKDGGGVVRASADVAVDETLTALLHRGRLRVAVRERMAADEG
jgi:exodeoxyribonuclease VII large subunit